MDTTTTAAMVAAMAILICLSAFFSMSETAYTGASPIKIRKMADDGDAKAERALRILDDYDRFLTTILIGNNIVNIGASAVATTLFAFYLGEALGATVSTVVLTLIILTFGEIAPKSYANRNPEKACIMMCSAVAFAETVLYPLSWVFTKLTRFINRNAEETVTMTEDELEVMVDSIEDEGVIEAEESELIKSAIRFDDKHVSEIYTPRIDIVAVGIDSSPDELKEVITSSGFSRIPVYEGTIDNIVGVVYAKECFTRYFQEGDHTVRDLLHPVKYVPETLSLATVLKDLQKSKTHMAVVLDSYGGTLGVVTLEDVIEELVGDIWDESDDIQLNMTEVRPGTYNVKGMANIFGIMEKLGVDFDPGEYEDHTINGYIFYRLERMPVKGDTVALPGATITVTQVKGRRVTECQITLEEPVVKK